jgi:uncharacterized membrane protein YjjP (DUF1212 family)
MFSSGSLLFTESMRSEGISKHGSAIFQRKDRLSATFQSFFTMLASSLAGLIWYQFGADVTFIVTAFASILIGLYFIFMTKKHNLNTYALITLLYHKPPPIP